MNDGQLYKKLINKGFSGVVCTKDLNIILDFIKAENERLKEKLKDNTHQVCEKIREHGLHKIVKGACECILISEKILDQIERGEL